MSPSKSILCVSRHKQLQDIRAMVLEKAGYRVAIALNDEHTLTLVEEPNDFSLVLLCHSVPEVSRVELVSIIKKLKPGLPIPMLYSGYGSTEAKVDGSLHGLDSQESLLEMIGFLTKHVSGLGGE